MTFIIVLTLCSILGIMEIKLTTLAGILFLYLLCE